MIRHVITDPYDPAQLDIESLRRRLAASGRVGAEQIAGFRLEPLGADNSKAYRVHLEYTQPSLGLPASLFLKLCSGGAFGRSEVDYYTADYVRLDGAPLPVCYDAAYEDGAYHLLLEDLSGTHRNRWEAAPTPAFGTAAAAALAKLHAHHRGAKPADGTDASEHRRGLMKRYLAYMTQGCRPMLDALDRAADAERRDVAEHIFAKLPEALLRRTADGRGFTLVHGDLNPGNMLTFGANDDAPDVRFIDRQPFDWSLTHWVGPSDLSYMMGLWWKPELRRAYETEVLDAYYEGLLACGVADYPRDLLLYDYRLTNLQNVYVAASWCIDERERRDMRWLWEAELDRALAAYRDLDGASLLDESGRT